MTALRTYLDHNATTPLLPAARRAMIEACDRVGNPSSIHAEGRAVRAIVEVARRRIARLAGVPAEDVVFTSGATEALNTVLTPELSGADGACDILLIGAGEHPAVVEGHRFSADRTETVALDQTGQLDLAALAAALARHAGRRVMLAIQAANNETGVLQPVAEAAAMVHAAGGLIVCDAVQAPGKVACTVEAFGADVMVISGHKFGAPKGVGALIFAPGRAYLRYGLVLGGGQERGLRSGTENSGGIAALGAAADVAMDGAAAPHLEPLRDAVERVVLAHHPHAVVFGKGAPRLPNTVSFALPGIDAQVLTMNLDLAGVAVSAGSACSSGKVRPSRVLRAMGVAPEIAAGMVRVSLGWSSKQDDVAAFEAALAKAVGTMRSRAARAA